MTTEIIYGIIQKSKKEESMNEFSLLPDPYTPESTMGQIMTRLSTIKPTLMWGNIPLYNNKDAVALFDYCFENNIGILGIEGFITFEDGKRMPKMDWIVDFSDFLKHPETFVQQTINISRNFLQSAPENILFEFVLQKEG